MTASVEAVATPAATTQPHPGPTITAENLGRRFGDFWAIRGVNFNLERGEVFGLLGPNGAGKTTTVRLLTALIAPSEGRASIDGFDVVDSPEEVRSRIGLLTETPGLYERLTARQNLDFFGRLHGLSPEVRERRIEQLLRLFDIWDRRDDQSGNFSKGMKQKLAIARALLHEPSVLFFDEPTSGLDPEAAFIVRDAIAGLKASGRTIVLCTHNLDEAERLCDRVAFVRGKVLGIDSPSRLRANAGTTAVEITLAQGAAPALLATLRALPGVRSVEGASEQLSVQVEDARRDTPALVRALAAANADVLGVTAAPATLETVYFDIMGVRPPANGGGLMRRPIVNAVIGRDGREFLRNRLLLSSVLIPPVVLSVLPIVIVSFAREAPKIPPAAVAQIVAGHPQWAGFTSAEVAMAFALQQFLITFLILPGYIPLSIASYSIVGEKQSRSLEAVLATPIRTSELLTGKMLVALVPAILAAWLAYLAMLALAAVLLGPNLAGVLREPAWIGAVFALGPAIGLISVTAGLIVSSRVNDPRSAQQIGAVILLPLIAIVVVQTAGNFLLDLTSYLLAAVVATIIGLILLQFAVVVFGRETILTRWK